MSRRATGFKYVSGRSAELKQFESNQVSRSLTSLVSNSPNNSITTTRRPSDIAFDSNLHLQPLSQSFRHHGGSGGGGEQLQMTPTRCPAAGGSGERRRQRGSSRRGSSGMPSMVWSNGDLSVPQLIQDFADTKRLPVIVKVTQGYYGDGQLKLPIGQVLQIYETCEEQRVRAVDGKGRQLSLPFSQVQSMDVRWNGDDNSGGGGGGNRSRPRGPTNNVGTNGSGCMKLGDVLQEAALPVTVSVLKTTNQEDASRLNDLSLCSFPLGTQLTVQSIYTCTHLLANVIENGWLDSSSIVTIPEDLRPQFRVASGLKDATPDEWKDFSGMFDRAARHIRFSGVKGYNGVIYEDWSEFSMTCEDPDESEWSPSSPMRRGTTTGLVEIERYLINKKQLPQSTTSSSSSSLSSPLDNNNLDHVRRFPKTSPYLGNRRTVFVPNCSNSSSSIFPSPASATVTSSSASADSLQSLSSLDSAVAGRLSSRTVSGTSGTSGFLTDVPQNPGPRKTPSESSEPDYANIDDADSTKVPLTIGLAAGGQHGGSLPHRGDISSNLQRKNVARVEDVALEDLSVGGQRVKCGPTTGDSRGTLISIDEGYSTKDSSRSSAVSDAATQATSAKKRYSPVYF